MYFTDPCYGRFAEHGVAREPELGFQGVYRVAPGGAPELLVARDAYQQPNGLCFSPDETVLRRAGERVPEVAANLAWGGEDWRTLFVTAGSGLYAVPTLVGPRREPFMGRVS